MALFQFRDKLFWYPPSGDSVVVQGLREWSDCAEPWQISSSSPHFVDNYLLVFTYYLFHCIYNIGLSRSAWLSGVRSINQSWDATLHILWCLYTCWTDRQVSPYCGFIFWWISTGFSSSLVKIGMLQSLLIGHAWDWKNLSNYPIAELLRAL